MQSFTYAEIQNLFTFPFRDPRWKSKLLIGSLISLAGFMIPFIPWIFVYGYGAQIMHRIILEGGEPYLPEWDDWDKLFKDGLRLGGVIFVVMLPLAIFLLLGYGLTVIPQLIIAFRQVDNRTVSPLLEIIPVVGMVISWIIFGLGMLGGIVVGVMMPAAQGHVVATNQFAAAFRIKEWWPIFRANLGGFIIAYIIITGAAMAISLAFQILYLTIIFCCLMPFAISVYMIYQMIVWSTLMGQTYRAGVDKLATLKLNPS
jgi:hypothetical protein